jgi:hypothetical protein
MCEVSVGCVILLRAIFINPACRGIFILGGDETARRRLGEFA